MTSMKHKAILSLTALLLLLTCVPVHGASLSDDTGPYPRMGALATSNIPSVVARQEYLNALGAMYDSVTLAMDADTWLVPGTGQTVVKYLRARYPKMTIGFYAPGGFFWHPNFVKLDCATHRTVCEVQSLIKEDDWLRDTNGQYVTVGGKGNVFLNPLTDVQKRLGIYWANKLKGSDWDFVHWDLSETKFNANGGYVDMNRDGVVDRFSPGLTWLTTQYTRGNAERMAEVAKTGLLQIGNAAWQPGDPYHDLSGAFVELAGTYLDDATGIWSPPRPDVLAWQLDQVNEWKTAHIGAFDQVVAMPSSLTDYYWSRYWSDTNTSNRVALTVALLTGSEFILTAPTMPSTCDECTVVNGRTSATGGAGWLGAPLDEMICLGAICLRNFERGRVYLNTSPNTVQVPVTTLTGLQQIAGIYESPSKPRYNAGGSWNGLLPGHNGRVLWRSQTIVASTPTTVVTKVPTVTSTATSIPKPMITATPMPAITTTPTPSLTEQIRLLIEQITAQQRKIESLQQQIDELRKLIGAGK